MRSAEVSSLLGAGHETSRQAREAKEVSPHTHATQLFYVILYLSAQLFVSWQDTASHNCQHAVLVNDRAYCHDQCSEARLMTSVFVSWSTSMPHRCSQSVVLPQEEEAQ